MRRRVETLDCESGLYENFLLRDAYISFMNQDIESQMKWIIKQTNIVVVY